MKRRTFIALLGGAATWPLAARGQQVIAPATVGWLDGRTRAAIEPYLATFRQALAAHGYLEGSNLKLEFRFTDGQAARQSPLAADLLRQPVSVVVTAATSGAAIREINPTIPIVFLTGDDPVNTGNVRSLNRPGGNSTGVFIAGLGPKRLGIFHELLPRVATFAVLVNPTGATSRTESTEVQSAARTLGLNVNILNASTDLELDAAFAGLKETRAGALLVTLNPFFSGRVERLARAAARIAMPAMYVRRDFPAAGGLISYGANDADNYRLLGDYTGRILSGAKAADLPVQYPAKFEMTINLKTAKMLGIEIPATVLALADEVIE